MKNILIYTLLIFFLISCGKTNTDEIQEPIDVTSQVIEGGLADPKASETISVSENGGNF